MITSLVRSVILGNQTIPHEGVVTLSFLHDLVHLGEGFFIETSEEARLKLHSKRVKTIDIFKIDCDECEYETYESWLNMPGDVEIK